MKEIIVPRIWIFFVFFILVSLRPTGSLSANTLKANDHKNSISRQLSLSHLNSTSVMVNWTSFISRDSSIANQCPVQLYIIRLKQNSSKQTKSWKVDGARESLTLHDLRPNTEHFVRLLAILCDGKRRKSTRWYKVPTISSPVSGSVKQAPGPPTSLQVWTVSNTIFVTWLPPHGSVVVRGYTVGYGEGVPDIDFKYVDASQRSTTILDLKYLAQYVVSVRSFNEAGRSEVVYDIVYTKEKRYTTPSNFVAAAPSALPTPTNIIVKLSSRTISLQWTDPSLDSQQKISDDRFYGVYFQAVPDGKNLSVIVKALQVTLYDLEPNRLYRIKIRTVKGFIVSPFTDEIFHKTTREASSLAEDPNLKPPNGASSVSPIDEPEEYDYVRPSDNRRIDEDDNEHQQLSNDQQPLPSLSSSYSADVKIKRHFNSMEAQARRILPLNPTNISSPTPETKITFRSMIQVRISAYITWPENPPTVLVSCTSAPIDETRLNSVAGYLFRYKLWDDGDYIVTNLATNFVLLENLQPNSKYRYQVRYVADRGAASDWSQEAMLETGLKP